MASKRVTEDEVFDAYASGLPEDDKPDYSKARRNRFLRKEGEPEHTVQIALKIEVSTLEQLKELAEQRGIGYQTLLKQFVRDGIDRISSPLGGAAQKELEQSIQAAVRSVIQSAVLTLKSEAPSA